MENLIFDSKFEFFSIQI